MRAIFSHSKLIYNSSKMFQNTGASKLTYFSDLPVAVCGVADKLNNRVQCVSTSQSNKSVLLDVSHQTEHNPSITVGMHTSSSSGMANSLEDTMSTTLVSVMC